MQMCMSLVSPKHGMHGFSCRWLACAHACRFVALLVAHACFCIAGTILCFHGFLPTYEESRSVPMLPFTMCFVCISCRPYGGRDSMAIQS
jgi:hypothetical protein